MHLRVQQQLRGGGFFFASPFLLFFAAGPGSFCLLPCSSSPRLMIALLARRISRLAAGKSPPARRSAAEASSGVRPGKHARRALRGRTMRLE